MANTKKKKSTFKLELNSTRLIYLVLIFFIGMCWAFILGLIVGRGYNLNKIIPQNNTPKITSKKQEKIIPPEKLVFMDKLQETSKQKKEQTETQQAKQISNQNKTPTKKDLKKNNKQTNKKIKKETKKNKPKSVQKTKTYKYVYQFAAYKKQHLAQAYLKTVRKQLKNFCQKENCSFTLEKAKIKNTTWYRVLLIVKTSKNTSQISGIIKKSGLKKFILRQK
ncbi:MAG: hypothetical protein Q9M37_07425 [Desulfonauticus sp.]|nr:hypothetical protein [Desulfonauticus sp.]